MPQDPALLQRQAILEMAGWEPGNVRAVLDGEQLVNEERRVSATQAPLQLTTFRELHDTLKSLVKDLRAEKDTKEQIVGNETRLPQVKEALRLLRLAEGQVKQEETSQGNGIFRTMGQWFDRLLGRKEAPENPGLVDARSRVAEAAADLARLGVEVGPYPIPERKVAWQQERARLDQMKVGELDSRISSLEKKVHIFSQHQTAYFSEAQREWKQLQDRAKERGKGLRKELEAPPPGVRKQPLFVRAGWTRTNALLVIAAEEHVFGRASSRGEIEAEHGRLKGRLARFDAKSADIKNRQETLDVAKALFEAKPAEPEIKSEEDVWTRISKTRTWKILERIEASVSRFLFEYGSPDNRPSDEKTAGGAGPSEAAKPDVLTDRLGVRDPEHLSRKFSELEMEKQSLPSQEDIDKLRTSVSILERASLAYQREDARTQKVAEKAVER